MIEDQELGTLVERTRRDIPVSRRRRLAYQTCYSHNHIADWIQECTGVGWLVVCPTTHEDAPAGWPCEGLRKSALNYLVNRGVSNAEWELEGHCESMAMVIGRVAVTLIRGKTREEILGEDVANRAQCETTMKLKSLKHEASAAHVFGPIEVTGKMDKGVPGKHEKNWFGNHEDDDSKIILSLPTHECEPQHQSNSLADQSPYFQLFD